jgi:hypothetical protein
MMTIKVTLMDFLIGPRFAVVDQPRCEPGSLGSGQSDIIDPKL